MKPIEITGHEFAGTAGELDAYRELVAAHADKIGGKMSEPKVYIITNKHSGDVLRYVRAYTLNGAVRAYSEELLVAKAATSGEMFQAFKNGFEVLDAVAPEQADIIEPEEKGDVL